MILILVFNSLAFQYILRLIFLFKDLYTELTKSLKVFAFPVPILKTPDIFLFSKNHNKVLIQSLIYTKSLSCSPSRYFFL